MNVLLRYTFLSGSDLVRNYGDHSWHIVRPGEKANEGYCRRICKDPETGTPSAIDGDVCGQCLRMWDHHNTPKSYKERPYVPYIPPAVNRTKPVNPRGVWRYRWATDGQKKRLKQLYPAMAYMTIDGLTGGEAAKLIEAHDGKINA
jgi:hypothetical protein